MNRMVEAYHEDPVVLTFMIFIQSAREVLKYSDSRFFQGLHLSTVKYIVLKALAKSGGTLTNSDLAIWTGTERHNITTLVKRMKAEGLITTGHSEKDKRFVQVQLTGKGRDVLVQANIVAYDIIKRVMSGINKQQAAQLGRLLNILRENAFKAL